MRGRYPLTLAPTDAASCAERARLGTALGDALRRSGCLSDTARPPVEHTLRELAAGKSGSAAVLHCLLGDIGPLYPAILGAADSSFLHHARRHLRGRGGTHPTALLFNSFLAILDAARADGADRAQLRQRLATQVDTWWHSITESFPAAAAASPVPPAGQLTDTTAIAAALSANPQPSDTALLDVLAQAPGACQRAQLALDWINQQAQDSLLPAPVRQQVRSLRPWLIRIAICDEGVLLCASHPLRRLTLAYIDDAIHRHWIGQPLRAPDLPDPGWLAAAAIKAAAHCPAYSDEELDWLGQRLGQSIRDRHTTLAQRANRYVHNILRERLRDLPDHAALMPLFARDFEPLLLTTLRSHGTASPAWSHLMQRLGDINERLEDDHDSHCVREEVARELIACEVGASRVGGLRTG